MKNLAVHRNPVYPMGMTVAGLHLPGPEEVYSDAPPYLAAAPRMQRFAYSVFEVGIRPMGDTRRWTVDQWMPRDATGNRMGGFFSGYVVGHLALLAWFTWRDRSRAQRAAAITFGVVTLFAANAPQSHELRYYMFWMLLLVAVNLVAVTRRARTCAESDDGVAVENAFSVAALVAVAIVVGVTRGAYVVPSGYGFADLLRDRVGAETRAGIAAAGDGARVCLAKEPWTILYVSTFHPPARYQVVEAESEAQCGGARFVP